MHHPAASRALPGSLLAVAITGGLFAVPGAITAAPASSVLTECAPIVSDQARLDCYDRVSGRDVMPLASTPASEPMQAPAAPASNGGAPGARSAAPTREADSMIDSAWGFEPGSERYLIDFYRQNYVLLANYTNNINNRPFSPIFEALEGEEQDFDSVETRFQLSFKFRIWASHDRRFGLWAAYTQMSQWQVYNEEISRPFRETNYQPELFATYRPNVSFAGFHWRLLKFGYDHESNGRSDPISRSWDRLIAEVGIERGDLALLIRPWIRIDKDDSDDDNPDITDYMGHGDITGIYRWRGHSFALMGRGNLATGKGAAALTWTTPPLIGPLRGYVRGFAGYGDSLIDYNWNQQTIGAGLTLNSLL
jgi:phospholipase A1